MAFAEPDCRQGPLSANMGLLHYDSLTVIFSLIFMMLIFRGLLFVILVFAMFLSLMIFISCSETSKWPIMREEETP